MSINLALADASNNCKREGANATISLKSGLQFTGKLKRDNSPFDTCVIHTEGGGWVTVLIEEIAAVSSHR